jgi:hypothetical protein
LPTLERLPSLRSGMDFAVLWVFAQQNDLEASQVRVSVLYPE